MIRLLLLLLTFAPLAKAECVVLLHGLQGNPRVMAPMAQHLAEAGFVTFNGGYPSTKAEIKPLANYILPQALNACPKTGKIHVVAHSMGGLLLRSWQDQTDRLGRVVMIGTPNKGSEIVDFFGKWPLYRAINGPAAQEMTTKAQDLPQNLPLPKGEVGIILGTKSRSWLFSAIIPGPDDGRVSVQSALSPNAAQTLAVAIDHNALPLHPVVITHVASFLKTGLFKK